ncbi:MAG: hypothetical protein K6G18_10080 [Treponema sp.]|nr:hypothetical protein [Treponema sp.]
MSYLYSLADESVRCAMNLKTHKCNREQCRSCPVWQRIEACSAELDNWEKLEVQRLSRIKLADRIYVDRSYNRTNRLIKFVVAMLLVVGFLALGKACELHAQPMYFAYDYYVNDNNIRAILQYTHRNVHDCDLDRKVNCCDYTLQFKKEWDKVLPPNQCEIVRNYWQKPWHKKPTMNHLFVRVRLTPSGKWLYVEPQAGYSSYEYRMEDYWRSRYNSRYNKYGETAYWLSTWRR